MLDGKNGPVSGVGNIPFMGPYSYPAWYTGGLFLHINQLNMKAVPYTMKYCSLAGYCIQLLHSSLVPFSWLTATPVP